MNKRLLDGYPNKWSESEIGERGFELSARAIEIWPRPIS